MTTTYNRRHAARFAGWLLLLLLLLLGAGSGVCRNASALEAERLTPQHVCHGQCTPCQQAPTKFGVDRLRTENACVRAGDPHRVAWYAKPSRNKRDSVGYVGGNTAWRGEPPMVDEGTWGLDYAGLFFKNHNWLKWLHGRPSRRTGGSYVTDGPHFLSH